MGADGVSDFYFWDASLERVGGIGKVGFVPFAVRSIFVGEMCVVEKFKSLPGMLLEAYACLDRPLGFHILIEQPVLNLGKHLMSFCVGDAFGECEFELRVGKEPIWEPVLRFWVGKAGKAAKVPPGG